MNSITTHVLDTARGLPAAGVPIRLEYKKGAAFEPVGSGVTDSDGRLRSLLAEGALLSGEYRITFDTGTYFSRLGVKGFYSEVAIQFLVENATEHFHVPLLISPYGYSTYRGS